MNSGISEREKFGNEWFCAFLNDYTKPLMKITEVLKWREDILTHGTPLALFKPSLTYSTTKIVWEEAFR